MEVDAGISSWVGLWKPFSQEDGGKWSSGKFCFSRYEPLSSNMFSKPFPTVLEGMKDDWELML